MRYELIDRIVELVPGEKIVAIKAVTQAEEYLADHFPTFPVFPGVLMLEALSQAAAWLVRESLENPPSIILLCSAKNVTYKSFVKPGHLLRLEVTCRRLAQEASDFVGTGYRERDEVVRARFALTHFSLGAKDSRLTPLDDRISADARARHARLRM